MDDLRWILVRQNLNLKGINWIFFSVSWFLVGNQVPASREKDFYFSDYVLAMLYTRDLFDSSFHFAHCHFGNLGFGHAITNFVVSLLNSFKDTEVFKQTEKTVIEISPKQLSCHENSESVLDDFRSYGIKCRIPIPGSDFSPCEPGSKEKIGHL